MSYIDLKTSTCLCSHLPSSYWLDLHSLFSVYFFSFLRGRQWHQFTHICWGAATLFLAQYFSSCRRWYMVSHDWCCFLPQKPRHHDHTHAQRLASLEKNSLFSYYCFFFFFLVFNLLSYFFDLLWNLKQYNYS